MIMIMKLYILSVYDNNYIRLHVEIFYYSDLEQLN